MTVWIDLFIQLKVLASKAFFIIFIIIWLLGWFTLLSTMSVCVTDVVWCPLNLQFLLNAFFCCIEWWSGDIWQCFFCSLICIIATNRTLWKQNWYPESRLAFFILWNLKKIFLFIFLNWFLILMTLKLIYRTQTNLCSRSWNQIMKNN